MNEHVRASKGRQVELDLSGTFIRRTDLSHANLERADLSDADCANAIFRGANFKNAILDRTNLRGADLTDATNLTKEQIGKAILDDTTKLPGYLQ